MVVAELKIRQSVAKDHTPLGRAAGGGGTGYDNLTTGTRIQYSACSERPYEAGAHHPPGWAGLGFEFNTLLA